MLRAIIEDMARESRIKSESLRRAVIGLVMGCLLAASTAAAVLISNSPRAAAPTHKLKMTKQTVRMFSMLCPADWLRTDHSLRGSFMAGYAAVFADTSSAEPRKLVVMEMAYARPTAATLPLNAFVSELTKEKIVNHDFTPTRIGGFGGFVGSIITISDQGPKQRLIAVLSQDGMRYLGLSIARSNGGAAEDMAILQVMAESAVLAHRNPGTDEHELTDTR